ncbi:aspartyl protease family protein [Flavobacterium sp.]|uniref:aspartyl protease family protein n=1 Tax=Flavobacterium sp. TaxID=239 RepID=UPI002FDD1B4E
MRLLFTFCFLFIAFIPCRSQSGFQIDHNKRKIVIPFKLINNLIFIPIKVNGETLTFLLDTGVEETVLFSLDDKEQVSLYHLEKIMLKGLGGNNAAEAYKSSRNKLEVNGFTDKEHEIYLVLDQEFNFSSQVGIPVNGIIGYHFFKNHLVEIDYDRKKVTVYADNHPKIVKRLNRYFTKEPLLIEENKPYYYATVESAGKRCEAKLLIDTGNSDAIWLFLNRTNQVELPAKNIDDFLGRGFSGNVYGKRGRISRFTFGNHSFANAIGTFPDSTSIKSVNFVKDRVGSLGGEVLSRFSVFFDYPNHLIFTKSNHNVNQPFNFNMSGIEVQHDGLEWVKETYEDPGAKGVTIKMGTTNEGRFQDNLRIKFELKPVFKIYNVRAGSTAELAGLQKDDKILKINKQNAHALSIEKINELLKSEEGKIIEMEVDRKGHVYTFRFQLKSII